MSIELLIETAERLLEKLKCDEDLHEPKELGIDENKDPAITLVLSIIGAIRTVQGTEKIYKTVDDTEIVKSKLNKLKSMLIEIKNKLEAAKNKQLVKSDILQIIGDHSFNDDSYSRVTYILSNLNIATSIGKGRIGGLKLYDIAESKKEIEEVEQKFGGGKDQKKREEHESVLYPAAVKVLTDKQYEAIITGGKRRFEGEWNTPDVIGYKIIPYETLIGCNIELVTVEVKWDLDRDSKKSIAEANSHKKFSHKSYLMVDQSYTDLDQSVVRELMEHGIGLICKDTEGGYKIQIPCLKNNNPEIFQVDRFLSNALENDQKGSIQEDIAKFFLRGYFDPFIGRSST